MTEPLNCFYFLVYKLPVSVLKVEGKFPDLGNPGSGRGRAALNQE